MSFNYLSDEILRGFDTYKYSSVDNSPVSNYVTHPFWNWVVKFLPRWLAPNLMTLAGFVQLLVNFFLLTYYDPHFWAASDQVLEYPPIPAWVWLVCGLNNFISHTLDGCDGKQARRTNSSTPLGELFDHGLDSWAALCLPVAIYSVFGRDDWGANAYTFYLVLACVLGCFIMSHWEKYNTGILFLPWGYDISQLAMTGAYLITFAFGYQFWKNTILLPIIGTVTVADLSLLSLFMGSLGMSLPMTMYNVYRAYKDKTGKMYGFYEAMRPLLSCFALFILITLWIYLSPANILLHQARLVYWTLGTIFSNITCRLIVSQMSSTRCSGFNWLLVPLILVVGAVLCTTLAKYEMEMAWGLCIFVTIAHIHYGFNVVRQLCDKLNIYALTLEKREKVTNNLKRK
ncbi:ethanolaminephosphotransferase 1-like [Lineus longissimus]|uniref:ethanolaminephosphotransferase 1-like n=1 Tax=Lineus longissimus TaxID=88925 RepID=UPI002B4D8E50